MHHHLPRPAAAAGTIAAVAALAMSGSTPLAAAPVASARPAALAATAAPPASSRQVLLINGDRLLASQAPRSPRAGAMLPAATGNQAAALTFLVAGGQAYEIPDAALPYLGRGLDPGLFRVNALLGREADGRLPVRVSYRGHVPALPGVTITTSAAGTARGYLTASSARVFGAALDRQYRADHARGSYGQDGMFASRASISLAGTAGTGRTRQAPSAHPGYAMRTLTVTAANLSGRPDTGDYVLVVNADNSNLSADLSAATGIFYHGVARFSVPAGHYWATGQFGGSSRNLLAIGRVAVLPQFSVERATTVHMAERAADSKITMLTPRPATARDTNFWMLRSSRSGPPVLLGWSDPSPIWVTPTSRRPTVGTLRAYASQQLASPPGPGAPYRYAVSYEDPRGIVSAQRYLVRSRDLAMISERYYQDTRAPRVVAFYGSLPSSLAGYVEPYPFRFTRPGRLIAYAGGNIPDMTWASYSWELGQKGIADSGQQSPFHLLPAGDRVTETWNAYPLHPAVNVNPDTASSLNWTTPSATRAGNTLRLAVTPFGDNQPGHLSFGLEPQQGARITARYRITLDGRRIAGGNAATPTGGDVSFTTRVKLSPKPSVISFQLDAARTGPAFVLSTASHTVWTWRSAHEPDVTVPAGWYCNLQGSQLDQHCAVQPMLTLRYAVMRMAPDGQVPAGRQTVDLRAGHLQLARAARVTRAAMSVSFDDGKTWHRARVSGSDGHYQAAFSAPAGAFVMMRTTARDAAGGSIAETITRAFQVAP